MGIHTTLRDCQPPADCAAAPSQRPGFSGPGFSRPRRGRKTRRLGIVTGAHWHAAMAHERKSPAARGRQVGQCQRPAGPSGASAERGIGEPEGARGARPPSQCVSRPAECTPGAIHRQNPTPMSNAGQPQARSNVNAEMGRGRLGFAAASGFSDFSECDPRDSPSPCAAAFPARAALHGPRCLDRATTRAPSELRLSPALVILP